MKYFIRRKRDSRIVAGIFVEISTKSMAENLRKRWKENFPMDSFTIENQ